MPTLQQTSKLVNKKSSVCRPGKLACISTGEKSDLQCLHRSMQTLFLKLCGCVFDPPSKVEDIMLYPRGVQPCSTAGPNAYN